jgi:hypothetical protein
MKTLCKKCNKIFRQIVFERYCDKCLPAERDRMIELNKNYQPIKPEYTIEFTSIKSTE